jgi:Uma2 family endonuclease
MPRIPQGHRFEVVPDWVCEILSNSTESKDRGIKMPLYASYGVTNAWLLDPRSRSLEVYVLEKGAWRQHGGYGERDQVSAPPFQAAVIDLSVLWDDGRD